MSLGICRVNFVFIYSYMSVGSEADQQTKGNYFVVFFVNDCSSCTFVPWMCCRRRLLTETSSSRLDGTVDVGDCTKINCTLLIISIINAQGFHTLFVHHCTMEKNSNQTEKQSPLSPNQSDATRRPLRWTGSTTDNNLQCRHVLCCDRRN